MIIFLQNIVRFILLVLVQVFVLNNIRLLGYINPYIYILFILVLPVKFSRALSMLLAFILGLIIDLFSNTPGMHTFATVLVAFLRNPVINIFTTIEEGANPEPSFYTFGVSAFIKYIITLVLIHHTAFFFLEIFTFVGIGQTLLRIILNTLITSVILFGINSFKKK
ncbi:MAG: rod shape-determining protein MreD [Paludibacter sp.]|nr:rod shape-determining protein MreD [Paludibacter sp.]MDD4198098.1 rod shape-determining protein MreD [Paludibacter sp.]MDD4427680.1 rod shape-determining protein MreD [Paludibacter sp.]